MQEVNSDTNECKQKVGDAKNYDVIDFVLRVKTNNGDYRVSAPLNQAEDDEIIIESFLDGTEVSVGVITYKGDIIVLPITEIVSENDFFDYEAKYEGKSQEITPARISEAQSQEVSSIAKKIYQVLKLKG